MSEQEKNPMHFFKRLSEKSRALRKEAAEAGLGAEEVVTEDKPKRPRRRRAEKPQGEAVLEQQAAAEKPKAERKPKKKPAAEKTEGGKEKENTARGRKPRSEKPRNAENA